VKKNFFPYAFPFTVPGLNHFMSELHEAVRRSSFPNLAEEPERFPD